MEKLKQNYTKTENGVPGNIKYAITPTVKEMVEKINELVEAFNKLNNKKELDL